jgi:23S rRNA (cytosine1962-C5)-methyltransferase
VSIPTAWRDALERRRRQFAFTPQSTLRLLHDEDPYFRCDRFGPVCWFYCYRQPNSKDLLNMSAFAALADCPHWKAQLMQDRGRDPQTRQQWTADEADELSEWIGVEEGLSYYFRSAQGLSPGLFLDQRANRRWLRAQAHDKRVLNLFSYTGGFSLNAAAAGASEVVSVDLSRAFVNWSQTNFELNGLSNANDKDAADTKSSDTHCEFWATDVRSFLRGCAKRQRDFDLIICDPPSFARSRQGTFRIEKDLASLLAQIDAVLAPGGTLFFSSNYEKWDKTDLQRSVRQTLSSDCFSEIETPPLDADCTDATVNQRLKALVLERR